MLRLLVLSLSLFFPLVSSLDAQERDTLTADVTIGPAGGWGGTYWDRAQLAAEFTLAARRVTSSWTRALSVGVQGSPATVASADLLVCRDLGDGTCGRVPRYPTTFHAGILGGLSSGKVRILAGPAVFGGGSVGLGGQLQVDAAGGTSNLAFVGVARGSVIARANGERLRLASFGVGVRLR